MSYNKDLRPVTVTNLIERDGLPSGRKESPKDFMKLMKLAFRGETAVPMLAMSFASAVSVALLLARIAWTGELFYAGLAWNLFLAWLPLVFALLARDEFQAEPARRPWSWRFLGLAGAWLLFFPNAPYIFTDVIHLTTYFYSHFWVDLVLILLCA